MDFGVTYVSGDVKIQGVTLSHSLVSFYLKYSFYFLDLMSLFYYCLYDTVAIKSSIFFCAMYVITDYDGSEIKVEQ